MSNLVCCFIYNPTRKWPFFVCTLWKVTLVYNTMLSFYYCIIFCLNCKIFGVWNKNWYFIDTLITTLIVQRTLYKSWNDLHNFIFHLMVDCLRNFSITNNVRCKWDPDTELEVVKYRKLFLFGNSFLSQSVFLPLILTYVHQYIRIKTAQSKLAYVQCTMYIYGHFQNFNLGVQTYVVHVNFTWHPY